MLSQSIFRVDCLGLISFFFRLQPLTGKPSSCQHDDSPWHTKALFVLSAFVNRVFFWFLSLTGNRSSYTPFRHRRHASTLSILCAFLVEYYFVSFGGKVALNRIQWMVKCLRWLRSPMACASYNKAHQRRLPTALFGRANRCANYGTTKQSCGQLVMGDVIRALPLRSSALIMRS